MKTTVNKLIAKVVGAGLLAGALAVALPGAAEAQTNFSVGVRVGQPSYYGNGYGYNGYGYNSYGYGNSYYGNGYDRWHGDWRRDDHRDWDRRRDYDRNRFDDHRRYDDHHRW